MSPGSWTPPHSETLPVYFGTSQRARFFCDHIPAGPPGSLPQTAPWYLGRFKNARILTTMDAQKLPIPTPPPTAATSDAFVFFGATGDLAYKQIFPALQQMILRDNFSLPIIGVAKSGWTIDQLRARVRDSLTNSGGINEDAYAKMLQ